jgi:23S rRNA (adenine1618-N6)-methyltransferase
MKSNTRSGKSHPVKNIKEASDEKTNLHPRNPHRFQYDFDALIKSCRELAPFVLINKFGNRSVDFSSPEAVKVLNKAILKHFYNIQDWDIPSGYLCPPIPGRADYIHYLADLLYDNVKEKPDGKKLRGFDVGMGANCVYPLIGHQSYGWSFVGSDIDPIAVKSARRIIDANPKIIPFVECRLQTATANIFQGVVQAGEKFDFSICNPPFHGSLAEARAGSLRKWQNLGHQQARQKEALNFGGQHAELWCKGGESAFLSKMVDESTAIAKQCLWFTSLVSKKTTLPALYQLLKKAEVTDVRTIAMSQGQKISRILAWTFLDKDEQELWKKSRW